MNASLIAIYMKPEFPLALSFLEKLVHDGGFQLQNQLSGAITLIDEEGDFQWSDACSLATRISQREDTQFQFWEIAWDGKYPRDLYCRVMFKPGAVVIEFGELPRDSKSLLRGIWGMSQELLDNEQIVGLVVDLSGETEEYADWYGFFIEKKPYSGPCPTLLCVHKDLRGLPMSCLDRLRSNRPHHVLAYDGEMTYLSDKRQ